LTAALAAAAGAVGFSHSSLASPTQANSAVNLAALSLDNGQLSGLTSARIQARQLATRDSSRVELAGNDTNKKQAAAAQLAKARAAKLTATQALTAKRASALAPPRPRPTRRSRRSASPPPAAR